MWRDEAIQIIGCSWSTLRRYVKQGMIRYTDLPNGKRMYWDDDVYAIVGKRLSRENNVALYARVNRKNQESVEAMEKQQRFAYEWCALRGLKLDRVYEDWAPSTKFSHEDRPGLHSLLQDVFKKKVGVVVVETLDRFARVGGELFRELLRYYGVELVVINEVIKDPFYQREQEEDLAWILQQAGVERLDKLEGERKRPVVKRAEHPGKVFPDWDGAGLGPQEPYYKDYKHKLRKSHFKRMLERPQGGEHDLYDPKPKEGENPPDNLSDLI